jgi:hypothetical protein
MDRQYQHLQMDLLASEATSGMIGIFVEIIVVVISNVILDTALFHPQLRTV